MRLYNGVYVNDTMGPNHPKKMNDSSPCLSCSRIFLFFLESENFYETLGLPGDTGTPGLIMYSRQQESQLTGKMKSHL